MKIWVLIVISLLALAAIIVWTFATAALYRRGQCRTYPYYWCDTSWQCCKAGNTNKDCVAAGGTEPGGSYKITDKFYGTNPTSVLGDDDHNQYYHLCIAPANAIIAALPGTSLACLYDSTVSCPISFNSVPGYNANSYPGDPNGLQGRCYYYSVDDAPPDRTNPASVPTYNYLPGYSNGTLTNTGNGYYQNPKLGSINPYQSGYYFAGNSGPGQSSTNGFNNGPSQADSTYYSAWNRLGNPKSGV